MNKKLLVVLFGFLALAAATNQSEDEGYYTIDQAANLLNDLLEDSQQNLRDLQDAWAVKKPILEGIVAGLEADLQNKRDECANLDQVLADRQAELAHAQDYVAWLERRIQENTDLIASLLERRCQQNNNYIEGLKNDKLALKLLQFLRLQVQNKESFSFVQRKNFMRQLTQFLQVYKTGNYEQLVLLEQEYVDASAYEVNADYSTQQRTEAEVGVGHVDNDQGNIEVDQFQNGQRKGWYQVKQELLELLDNLERTINDKIAKAQEDEVNSNTAAADYKLKLEHENEVYSHELEKWRQIVVELQDAVRRDEENVATCRSQEAGILVELQNAQQNLAQETANFEHKQNNFNQEIEIFNEVIALYNPNLAEQGEDLKERVEDYSDNQVFDNGAYNDREIPDIEFIR